MEGSTFLAAETPPRSEFRRDEQVEQVLRPKCEPTEAQYRSAVMSALSRFPEAFGAVQAALFALAGEVP